MALLRTATSSDLGPVIQSDRVLLRTPQMSDYPDWAELRAASCEFLTPWEPLWAADELTRASYRRRVRHYLRDLREDMGYALFIFSAASGSLVGGSPFATCAGGHPGLHARLLDRRPACPKGVYDGRRPRCYPFRVRSRSSCTGSKRPACPPMSPPSSFWRGPASRARGWRAAI